MSKYVYLASMAVKIEHKVAGQIKINCVVFSIMFLL